MIEYMNYEKRLSPEAHYCLYRYYLSLCKTDMDYENFEITERLIRDYNRCSQEKKQKIADQISHDPQYPLFLENFKTCPWQFEKPVLWDDRKKTPYFIQQLKASHAFEVYIDFLFCQKGVNIGLFYGREQQYHKGETDVGIEIKYDKKSMETKNYYIEYQERMRGNAPWVNSGILKEDDTRFYLLGTINGFVIFERSWLMGYYHRLVEKREQIPGARLVEETAHGTSKGFILGPTISKQGNIPLDEIVKML